MRMYSILLVVLGWLVILWLARWCGLDLNPDEMRP